MKLLVEQEMKKMRNNKAFLSVLDELLDACRDYVLDNIDTTPKLSLLRAYIPYHEAFKKDQIDDCVFSILLQELVGFLL